jgi:hypothetical protein
VLFVTAGAAVGLKFYQDVRRSHDWPVPSTSFKIAALYLILGLTSEAMPRLSMALGIGFLVAFLGRQAQREIASSGTFFGVPVR